MNLLVAIGALSAKGPKLPMKSPVYELISMVGIKFYLPDHDQWDYTANDRSRSLDVIEPSHLSRLLSKSNNNVSNNFIWDRIWMTHLWFKQRPTKPRI